MHINLAKSSRFESNDFASVMIDDVRRHQCPQCEAGTKAPLRIGTRSPSEMTAVIIFRIFGDYCTNARKCTRGLGSVRICICFL